MLTNLGYKIAVVISALVENCASPLDIVFLGYKSAIRYPAFDETKQNKSGLQ